MSPRDEQFSQLTRLLALKRREGPPPGHFDRIARNIRRALEAEEASPAARWWERLLSRFDMEPAWAVALACTVVAAYLYGWTWSSRTDPHHNTVRLPASPDWVAAARPAWVVPSGTTAARPDANVDQAAPLSRSSVHPIIGMEPVRGWLTPGRTSDALPVSFSVGGP